MKQFRFKEIEGLRGYLAIWVALGHGLQISGYLQPHGKLSSLFLDGPDAVAAFMIVSGFVITHLIQERQERYDVYIVRRFMRLYPCYLVCCLIGYLISSAWVSVVQHAPWQTAPGWQGYIQGVMLLHGQIVNNFLPHFLLHLTMLHGLVPAQILPDAPTTFLPAAWSISLEWQFYLVAPLVLASIRRTETLVAVIGVAAVLLLANRHGLLGTYGVQSSLTGSSVFFAIGIASRLAFERLSKVNASALAIAAVSLFALMAFDPNPALMVWAVFFPYLVWGARTAAKSGTTFGANTGMLFATVFNNPVSQFLGRVSFSLYLIHRPIQVLVAFALVTWTVPSQHLMLLAQCLAIVLAAPAAWLLYTMVEMPGNRLAKRWADALSTTRKSLATQS